MFNIAGIKNWIIFAPAKRKKDGNGGHKTSKKTAEKQSIKMPSESFNKAQYFL